MNKQEAINKISVILNKVLSLNLKHCCVTLSEYLQEDIDVYLCQEKLENYKYVEFSSGGFYLGELVDGKAEGYGISFRPQNDCLYMGQWNDNKKEGIGFYYMSDGACYYGGFVDGMLYGNNSLFVSRDGVEVCADFIKDVMVHVNHSSDSFTYTYNGESYNSKEINRDRRGCLMFLLLAAFVFYLLRLIIL